MSIRKPILIVDDSDDSETAMKLFDKKSIEYVQYHVDKLVGGCCGGASDDTVL
jgi:methionine synthase I (cobalamin-dependent)